VNPHPWVDGIDKMLTRKSSEFLYLLSLVFEPSWFWAMNCQEIYVGGFVFNPLIESWHPLGEFQMFLRIYCRNYKKVDELHLYLLQKQF